jgi:hypothetical protein
MTDVVTGRPKTGGADISGKGKAAGKTGRKSKKNLILLLLGVAAVAGGIAAWIFLQEPALPAGFAGGR